MRYQRLSFFVSWLTMTMLRIPIKWFHVLIILLLKINHPNLAKNISKIRVA